MARRTLAERIKILEDERDDLESILKRNTAIRDIKGQGTDGASTEFTDPNVIREMLKFTNMMLEEEYKL